MSAEAAVVRAAARVLLVDETGRVLLLRGVSPETGEVFWFPVGGGLEPGEDARAAAVREVAEETGLPDLEPGEPVWRRRSVFAWGGRVLDQRELWFLARVPHFDVDDAGWTPEERSYVSGSRWCTVAELAATSDRLVPRDLAPRLAVLLRDGPPAALVDVGE